MSDQPASTANTPAFDLSPGLLEYYSSQAELMLAQYENINRLLGRTKHGTPLGDFCEVLLRDFFRKFLPPSLSADKGFFYGRAELDGKDIHSPEIDILIHDSQEYSPLFRMNDFVIVQPQAVRGMVQVKRTLRSDKVSKALQNIVVGKQHLLNVLWRDKIRGWIPSGTPPQVFAAIVGFGDEIGQEPEVYTEQFLTWTVRCRAYDRQHKWDTNMYVLPSFVGSLSGLCLAKFGLSWNQRYAVYNAVHDGANLGVQLLLMSIYHELQSEPHAQLPFAFPKDMKPLRVIPVLRITKAEFDTDGTILMYRNDKYRGRYRKAQGDLGQIVHLTCDGSSSLVVTEGLEGEPTLPAIIVERPTGKERYESVPPWEKIT